MKKILAITILVVSALFAFGFAHSPKVDSKDNLQNVDIKTGAEKSGFTETTSW